VLYLEKKVEQTDVKILNKTGLRCYLYPIPLKLMKYIPIQTIELRVPEFHTVSNNDFIHLFLVHLRLGQPVTRTQACQYS